MQEPRALIGEKIRRRIQRELEPVAYYFAYLYALFWNHLGPNKRSWTAPIRLRPRIQMYITRRQVRDTDEFEKLAIQVEENLNLAGQYRAAPPPGRAVYPEWAYQSTKRPAQSHAAVGKEENHQTADGCMIQEMGSEKR